MTSAEDPLLPHLDAVFCGEYRAIRAERLGPASGPAAFQEVILLHGPSGVWLTTSHETLARMTLYQGERAWAAMAAAVADGWHGQIHIIPDEEGVWVAHRGPRPTPC